jgi:hypothetical protein
MTTQYIRENGKITGWLTLADIYQFEGYTFEFHHYCGPIRCKKNGDPYARQPGKDSPFWGMIDRWVALPSTAKSSHRWRSTESKSASVPKIATLRRTPQ